MLIYYAGIGSRETPYSILQAFTSIASYLESKGFILRSGGAPGADSAFEKGVKNSKNKEIYLPWKNFNNNNSHLYPLENKFTGTVDPYLVKQLEMAKKYHPAWNKLSGGAQKMMARNCCQVLGRKLDIPSDFIICWTPNGKDIGGTAQALRIAKDYNIPIFNAGAYPSIDAFKRNLWKFLKEKYNL